jgi:predicted phage terminase large subunit-like protein
MNLIERAKAELERRERVKLEANAELARRSLAEFVRQAWPLVDPGMPLRWNWHVDAICEHLEAVSKGWIQRLLINIPPGHAKSLLVSVFWPAWEWAVMPTKQSIFASYAQPLAVRDSIRCRDLMTQPWYQRAFVEGRGPGGAALWSFNPAQNRVDDFANTLKGHRQCLSVTSAATGFRGNKVVVDDPINVKEAYSKVTRDEVIYWWSKVMPSRVNDLSVDAFAVIMQRVHDEDLSGYILEGGGYEHLCLPTEFDGTRRSVTYIRKPGAEPEKFFEDPRQVDGELLFPSLFPREVVEKLKKPLTGLGADFAGQYNQRPTAEEGGMFKRHAWKFWRPHAETPLGPAPRPRLCTVEPARIAPPVWHYQIGSLDAAFKDGDEHDYVVFSVWGIHGVERYLLDLVRAKLDFNATCMTLLQLARKWPLVAKWLVEDKANGTAVVNSLKGKVSGLTAVNPEGGKEARAAAAQPYVEAGQIYLPDGALYVEAFVDELANFPKGKHDDQVDSFSQAIVYLHNPDVARLIAMVASL